MKVLVVPKFHKYLLKLRNKELEIEISELVKVIIAADTSSQIPQLKRLVNSEKYRIRLGRFRIGLSIINDTLLLEYIGHRKDFYNYFP